MKTGFLAHVAAQTGPGNQERGPSVMRVGVQDVQDVGGMIKASKKCVSYKFTLDEGATEHTIVLEHSPLSGTKQLTVMADADLQRQRSPLCLTRVMRPG